MYGENGIKTLCNEVVVKDCMGDRPYDIPAGNFADDLDNLHHLVQEMQNKTGITKEEFDWIFNCVEEIREFFYGIRDSKYRWLLLEKERIKVSHPKKK